MLTVSGLLRLPVPAMLLKVHQDCGDSDTYSDPPPGIIFSRTLAYCFLIHLGVPHLYRSSGCHSEYTGRTSSCTRNPCVMTTLIPLVVGEAIMLYTSVSDPCSDGRITCWVEALCEA